MELKSVHFWASNSNSSKNVTRIHIYLKMIWINLRTISICTIWIETIASKGLTWISCACFFAVLTFDWWSRGSFTSHLWDEQRRSWLHQIQTSSFHHLIFLHRRPFDLVMPSSQGNEKYFLNSVPLVWVKQRREAHSMSRGRQGGTSGCSLDVEEQRVGLQDLSSTTRSAHLFFGTSC